MTLMEAFALTHGGIGGIRLGHLRPFL